jgi:hypothetical protein
MGSSAHVYRTVWKIYVNLRLWFPYASISWYGDTFHYQQFNDFEKSFQTEEQALAFGFGAARSWIDEHKSD